MLRLLAAIALASAPLVLAADTAHACSCVPRPYAEHVKAAKRVVLARAGKPIKTGDTLKQTFTVLATFKGPSQPTFVLDRRATPPCKTDFKDGEISILFSSDEQLDPCHGNGPIETMIPSLLQIITASGRKTEATVEAVDAALREALSIYLHQRPQIPVRHAPLAGQTITIDKSRLTFGKTASPDEIEIVSAFAGSTITYVQGRYKREGVRFTVMLYADGTTWKRAYASVVET